MYKVTFKEYAYPMMLRSVFSSIMHTADRTIAALFIGASALVATTLVSPMLYLIYSISALFIGGLGAYVGLLIGRGNLEKAKNTASGILIILGIVGVGLMIPTVFFSEQVVMLLGAKGPMVEMASTYLSVIAFSFPIMLLARGLDVLIYNDGSPRYSFKLGILVTGLNLILNVITVVFFNWGIMGLALSTVVSEMVMLVGGLYFYVFRAQILKFAKPQFSFKTILRIAYNGLSEFSMMFVDAVMIFVLNQAFIQFLSPSHFEGYAAANVLIGLFYSLIMGAAMGLQPIHSQLMGKEDFVGLKSLLYYSVKKTVGIVAVVYLISIPISSMVLPFFAKSPEVLNNAKFFYLTIGFAVLFSNLPLQTSAFFTAINRPLESVLISVARTLILIPTLVYFSVKFIGGIGVALGYITADILLILVLCLYLKALDISKLKVYE